MKMLRTGKIWSAIYAQTTVAPAPRTYNQKINGIVEYPVNFSSLCVFLLQSFRFLHASHHLLLLVALSRDFVLIYLVLHKKTK